MQDQFKKLALTAIAAAAVPLVAQAQGATPHTQSNPTSASAQAPAGASAISQVLLYPGGAQVDRSQRVSAGARQARFSCLPVGLDRDALQVQAPAGVNLGELKVERVARDTLPECRRRDPQVRELEKQKAAIEAEISGVDIALAYLKGLSDREAKPGAGLAAGVDALRRNGQDLTARRQALKERLDDLGPEIASANAASPPVSREVSVVTVRLSATTDADIGLSYRLNGAGWQPQYRARLDTATGALSIERLAQIAQSSGEDWTDVKLRLSTVRPRHVIAPPALNPWTLSIAPPPTLTERAPASARMFSPSAPAPVSQDLSRIEITGSRVEAVKFDASVFEGEFGTEYDLPQRVTMRANGEVSTVSLGQVAMAARLVARVQPRSEAAAYLIAELPRPQGSWPGGTVQLFRDNSLVGQSLLHLGTESTWTLPFGRDDRLRVRVEADRHDAANTGLIGARRESVVTRSWQVENLRTRPVTLQVLEAAPVSEHQDIRVTAQFSPPVTQAGWRDQAGVQMWELPLAPNQTQRFQAVYRISVPKDAAVVGLP